MENSQQWKISMGILLSFALIWIFGGIFYLIRRFLLPNSGSEASYEILHQHFDEDEIEFSKAIERSQYNEER